MADLDEKALEAALERGRDAWHEERCRTETGVGTDPFGAGVRAAIQAYEAERAKALPDDVQSVVERARKSHADLMVWSDDPPPDLALSRLANAAEIMASHALRLATLIETLARGQERQRDDVRELIAAAERAREVLRQVSQGRRKNGPVGTAAQSAAWQITYALRAFDPPPAAQGGE